MDIFDNYLLFVKSTSILNETQKYEIIKILCKYITIFHPTGSTEVRWFSKRDFALTLSIGTLIAYKKVDSLLFLHYLGSDW